jgi:glycosyltransferase involved in cell wall biosynthesis
VLDAKGSAAGAATSMHGKHILVLSPTPTFPLDHGNRKRIYTWCREFQRRGAKVHFVYYPLEWPFSHIPADSVKAMQEQWDGFYMPPVTMKLYEWAKGEDHLIDEWFDRSIGDVLQFLFSRFSFDAFIVNYPFLSKAFEWCPPRTFKILDTHDKFTGRRELLERNGIQKEFFYTTEDQEKIALDRADLVWAIKDEEAEFFRTITSKPVITLPHIEPLQKIRREQAPEDEGYLVVGMIGARNNINRLNAIRFIDAARPMFRNQLAPIKIRLAGGMCDDLARYRGVRGIDVMGRVGSVDEFYRAVDVVLVPMSFSTGLKIKAIEAFATGLPIVANEHAVEGIPVTHPFHKCATEADVAKTCLEIAYNPTHLDELREASLATNQGLHRNFREALDQTCSMVHLQCTIAIAIGSVFFQKQSLYRHHVLQLIEYLRNLGKIVLYADEIPPLASATRFDLLNGLGAHVQLVTGKALPQPDGIVETSAGLTHSQRSIGELLKDPELQILWLEAIPQDLPTALPGRQLRIFARADSLQLLGHTEPELAQLFSKLPRLTTVDAEPWAEPNFPDQHLQIPYFRWIPEFVNRERRNEYWLLGESEHLDWMRSIRTLLEAHGKTRVKLVVSEGSTEGLPSVASKPPAWEGVAWTHEIVADARRMPELPLTCAQFGRGPATNLLVELLTRTGCRVVRFEETLGSFVNELLEGDAEPARVAEFANDSGYAHLWKNIKVMQTLRM